MSSQYNCPICGTLIPLEDINVSNDIALCRKCGKTTVFSQICDAEYLAEVSAEKPPRGVRIERAAIDGSITICCKRIDKFALIELPFVLFWESLSFYAFCMTQIRNMKFSWTLTLIGLFFLLLPIKDIRNVLFGLFGKHLIMLNHGEGTVFCGIGRLGRTQHFTYSHDARAWLRQLEKHIGVHTEEIVVSSCGQDFAMCAMMPDKVKPFVAGTLQREIARRA